MVQFEFLVRDNENIVIAFGISPRMAQSELLLDFIKRKMLCNPDIKSIEYVSVGFDKNSPFCISGKVERV